jgi:hypothetical protein
VVWGSTNSEGILYDQGTGPWRQERLGRTNHLRFRQGGYREAVSYLVKITQQGAKFVGTSLIDSEFSRAGTEKFTGELGEGGIKNAKYNRPDIGWTDARGKISKDCNRMVIDDGKGVELTLERK